MIDEYLAVVDDSAFGVATEVTPKFVSPSDPAARWTGAHRGQAFFAYLHSSSRTACLPTRFTWRARR